MNIGEIKLDGDFESRRSKKSKGYQDDLPRLILLLLMLLAAVIGGYYNKISDQPIKIVNRSLKKSLGQPFRASLEGETTISDSIINTYRDHQSYTPGKGTASPARTGGYYSAITVPAFFFDAAGILEELRNSLKVSEGDREDMYGHGTRHFSGSLKPAGAPDSVICVYEYWIDIRSRLAVRLSVTVVERNAVPRVDDEPMSRVTYINIRYHDW
ncbi:hypothetical protein LLG96_11475 [bacterium]|nr:hypothetical protein [bacterium]